eukprot:CAMPEP_0185505786 /NCGR_PEP_ID=MMETSP1366-20130426/37874_1 /TAXON_ID=38817 /ORGANISM="Gephyrocapsa oceanica, Strain RCC1303" /LENGTH=74 /DNA_ID=CAMNT_0028115885 /DNA_START=112 /DNA_END=332 /DNA_ORIENTATION=+
MGTRPTQSTKVRHTPPRRSVRVSPAMCHRSSGHAILCSGQGKWGRDGVPRSVPWDFSAEPRSSATQVHQQGSGG